MRFGRISDTFIFTCTRFNYATTDTDLKQTPTPFHRRRGLNRGAQVYVTAHLYLLYDYCHSPDVPKNDDLTQRASPFGNILRQREHVRVIVILRTNLQICQC